MFNTVAQIFELNSEERLREAFAQTETELIEILGPLEESLDQTVNSMDPAINFKHAAFVDSWRNRVSKFLMLINAFVEHAKSDAFLLPKAAGITEVTRDMHRRALAGPFVAWQQRLENLIESIDNRVNFCKKCIAVEEAHRNAFNKHF